MKAVVEYTEKEYIEMQDNCRRLREAVKGTTRKDWFTDLSTCSGYAHYRFKGQYAQRLVELLGHQPSADEIIMLVDGGFSHFGATCTIDHATRRFSGRVNID